MSRFKSMNPFRDLLNPVDIYSAQNLLLKLSLVSGIAPLKLTGKSGNRRLKVNLFGFFILILHMGLFAFCYIKTITVHDSIVSYFLKLKYQLSVTHFSYVSVLSEFAQCFFIVFVNDIPSFFGFISWRELMMI